MWPGHLEIVGDLEHPGYWRWQRRSHDGAVVLRSDRAFRWQFVAARDARRCNPGLDLEVCRPTPAPTGLSTAIRS